MTSPTATAAAPLTDGEVGGLRGDFPLLAGVPGVYLDSGATSQKPWVVLEAEREFYSSRNAAVRRGAHALAVEATEAINLIACAFSNATAGGGGPAAARFRLGPGDEIVTTEAEHHANLVPWQELAARTGASLRWIPVDEHGVLDYEAAATVIGQRAKVVAFSHVSDVTGALTDVAALVGLARAVGALSVLDACQSVPHLPVDLPGLGVDFAVFSGHKMLGPTGIGALWGRGQLLEAMPVFLTGGSMVTEVTVEAAEYLPACARFEAGTQRIAQAVGLAAAVGYLQEVGMGRIAAHEHALGARLAEGGAGIEGVRLLGPPPGTGRVGLAASTRVSACLYTTTAEVDRFLTELAGVRAYFGVAG